MNISKEDYLKLLEEIAAEQDLEDNTVVPSITDGSWIWAEPPAKDKMKNITFNGVVDATKLRKDQIKDALSKAKNIQVDKFLIKIDSYWGPDPLEKDTFDIEIWERQTKTPTGQPCNMDFKALLGKDSRFQGRPWLKHFHGCYGSKVPLDTIVDIVRWMQALKRLTAFL